MCKLYRLLYRILPLRAFQALLIRKHLFTCPACKAQLMSEEELGTLFKTPDWVVSEESMWMQIKPHLGNQRKDAASLPAKSRRGFSAKWQWAMAGGALLIFIGLNIIMQRGLIQQRSPESAVSRTGPRLEIKYVTVKGKKAKPHIFQTETASFVLFTEIDESGG